MGGATAPEPVRLTGSAQRKQPPLPKREPSSTADSGSEKSESQGLPSPSLSETVRLAQQGDLAAFEAIYRLHSRRVYALCLRMLRDPVEAEDLTQDAFMQLFRKIHTFRGESAFSTWLYRLTANAVLMRLRRKKPLPASLDETTGNDQEDGKPRNEIGAPDLRLTGLFDRFGIEAAVNRLPTGYKLAFILHDVYGYGHNEIAEIRGCSAGNSKSQLHKARKRLREHLRSARPGGTPQNREALGVPRALVVEY